jgi:nitrate reductase NapAB chaperone NapD
MPNQITAAGLQVKTNTEIIADIKAALRLIYGADINLEQNSPDGQLVNIFGQAATDQLEMLLALYNSFSVANSFGILLDQRVALNGLTRRPGTYTMQDVTVTVDRALTLAGLDDDLNSPEGEGYTIEDDAGNKFILAATHVFVGAGSASLSFRAKAIGQVETTPNTITNQTTVVLGVTNLNNPDPADEIGENEETDAALKIRHAKSFMLAAEGAVDAIQAALLTVEDVVDALVVENDTDSPVDDIPAYSIWAIVDGGSDEDVGTAIYSKKMPGCGQKGGEEYVVIRPNGTSFTAKFDRALDENLYIRFSILPRSPGATFDDDAIKLALVNALVYRLNQSATIGDVVIAMLTIAPEGILTDVEVSDDGVSWFDILEPTTFQHKFVTAVGRITIL